MAKFKVKLSARQRKELKTLVRTGKQKAKVITHANILLQADSSKSGPGLKANKIAQNLNIHKRTVHRTRRKFAEEGLETALYRKEHKKFKPKRIDGEQEAHLIALCCSPPPEGRIVWTLQLLSENLVKMQIVDAVSRSTVHRTLKKMNLNRG